MSAGAYFSLPTGRCSLRDRAASRLMPVCPAESYRPPARWDFPFPWATVPACVFPCTSVLYYIKACPPQRGKIPGNLAISFSPGGGQRIRSVLRRSMGDGFSRGFPKGPRSLLIRWRFEEKSSLPIPDSLIIDKVFDFGILTLNLRLGSVRGLCGCSLTLPGGSGKIAF